MSETSVSDPIATLPRDPAATRDVLQAFVARDASNQYCASLRNRDQLASPAFGLGNLTQGASLYIDQATLQDEGHSQASCSSHRRLRSISLFLGSLRRARRAVAVASMCGAIGTP